MNVSSEAERLGQQILVDPARSLATTKQLALAAHSRPHPARVARFGLAAATCAAAAGIAVFGLASRHGGAPTPATGHAGPGPVVTGNPATSGAPAPSSAGALPAQTPAPSPSAHASAAAIPATTAHAATPAATASATGNDTVAPSAPSNVHSLTTSPTAIAIAWSGSTDNVGVASYSIWRSSTGDTPWLWVGSVPATTFSFTDNGVSAGITYSYAVRSFDNAGNKSASSNIVPIAASGSGPAASMSTFAGFLTTEHVASHSVDIAWGAPAGIAIDHYEVWRGDLAYANWAMVQGASTSLAFTDGTPKSGTIYTYSIIGWDAAGHKVWISNNVQVQTP